MRPETRVHAPAAALASLLLLLLLSAADTARAQGGGRAPLSYTVSMPQPHTHLLEVEMRLRRAEGSRDTTDLVMPVWTPGSYLIREYERHVERFSAEDAGGRALAWRKADKNTWRVETKGARELVARYRVYSNELTVRTNELNDRHAFWNNAALLMYPDGQLKAPSTVRVVPFGGWKVATGLPPVAGEANTFRAEDFDTLYDSPFLVSDFKELRFEVQGKPHRVVIDGEGNYDAERVRRDTQRIVEAAAALMGGELPYRDYTFLLMTHPTASGGLEHLNSTALIFRRFNFHGAKEYRDFLTLVAHEFFHLWNVKRIRPDALGPFDYTRENYTRLLWVAEGITAYYENVIVRRAGLMSDKEFLEINAKAFQNLQNTPGRFERSAEESSFDAWIKHYRPDENSVNSTVSYYEKGNVLGLLLDLEIRKRSKGARSLDDVMRHLNDEFFKKGRNYTPEDFQRAAERAAGSTLADFFRRYVSGHDELDYNAVLEAAGLRLDTAGGATDAGKPAVEKAFLGATFAAEGEQVVGRTVAAGALVVKTVPAGTPAYEQGLNAGDQIVAVDGNRATREFFDKRLEEKRPGDPLLLAVFRNDELRTFTLKLGARADSTYRILPVKQPTPEQMKAYQDWLAAPFPKAG